MNYVVSLKESVEKEITTSQNRQKERSWRLMKTNDDEDYLQSILLNKGRSRFKREKIKFVRWSRKSVHTEKTSL